MGKTETFTDDVNNFVGRVKDLVLNALGCECDEQLFEQVRLIQGEASPGKSMFSLVVGEQLLIIFADYSRLDPFDDEMPRLILAGLTYSDSIGFQQVRIVLPDTIPDTHRKLVDSELGKIDDRIHVHYIS